MVHKSKVWIVPAYAVRVTGVATAGPSSQMFRFGSTLLQFVDLEPLPGA